MFGFGYGGFGYGGFGGFGGGGSFVLIVVLFILLIIVGCACFYWLKLKRMKNLWKKSPIY